MRRRLVQLDEGVQALPGLFRAGALRFEVALLLDPGLDRLENVAGRLHARLRQVRRDAGGKGLRPLHQRQRLGQPLFGLARLFAQGFGEDLRGRLRGRGLRGGFFALKLGQTGNLCGGRGCGQKGRQQERGGRQPVFHPSHDMPPSEQFQVLRQRRFKNAVEQKHDLGVHRGIV